MGKSRDPHYWAKWRAAHPEYRERERLRRARRVRGPRDRSGEHRRSRAAPSEPLPVLYAGIVRGVRLSFWEDELRMDLAQEAELARLEGLDPVERCNAYLSRELAWRHFAQPLIEEVFAA